jgi:hypothetical protein
MFQTFSNKKRDFGNVHAMVGAVGGMGTGIPGPANATLATAVGAVGGMGTGIPGPAKATLVAAVGAVGGMGTGIPGPAKATLAAAVGAVGGMGTGMPGPEARATLVESVRTAVRMPNWNLKLCDVMGCVTPLGATLYKKTNPKG